MSLFIFKACRKIYKIIGTFTHPFYYLVALFSTRKSIPAITNPILVTSASELAKKIRTGELTCREVVSVFIERCKQVNVIVNAIIQDRFEAAIQDAQKVDAFLHYNQISISQLEKEKPLLGVPVTIKECCSVKGMKLSAGMKQYEKRVAAYNGDAVQKMINAGAIPIAVTSTPPHSLWIETFNDIIGYTSNPYDTRKSAGGSSGGEAALVASGASAMGLGSDAGGSIRIPAAFCGIYGHKPTKKFVSSKGHTTFFSNPVAENMLTMGPLCRYAVDLELAMNVLSANKLQESNFCAQIHLRQINIFYLFEFQQNICLVDDAIKKSIKDAIFYLNAEYGCKVKELAIQEFEQILEITFSHSLGLISSVIQENESEMFKRMLKIVHLTSPLDEKIFFKKQKNLQTRLLQLLEDNGVLLLPTWPESACYKYESVWKMINGCYTYFINAMGLTSTAIPVGMDRKKMPVSIQVIAAPTQDRLCISVAAELEKLFGGWMPPRNS